MSFQIKMLFALGTLLLLTTVSIQAKPYCVLRKPWYPPKPNCYEFYLADVERKPPSNLVGGDDCSLTPLALRQGWEVDSGPFPNWSTGDARMSLVSPFQKDLYGCMIDPNVINPNNGRHENGGGGTRGDGSSCKHVKTMYQAEKRDGMGRITVEAANIHVMDCPTGQIYIYELLNRPGFRAIRPPDWGRPLGGRDFSTFEEALNAATSGASQTGRPFVPGSQPSGYKSCGCFSSDGRNGACRNNGCVEPPNYHMTCFWECISHNGARVKIRGRDGAIMNR